MTKISKNNTNINYNSKTDSILNKSGEKFVNKSNKMKNEK